MNILDVKKFVIRTREGVCPTPKDSTMKDKKLAIELIFEELHEYAIACNLEQVFDNLCVHTQTETYKVDPKKDTTNTVKQLDALADIIYSTIFSSFITGHGDVLETALDIVSSSNISKTYNKEETDLIRKDVDDLASRGITDITIHENAGFACLKNSKGKIVKGSKYVAPNLEDIKLLTRINLLKEKEVVSLKDLLNEIDKVLYPIKTSKLSRYIQNTIGAIYLFDTTIKEQESLDFYFKSRLIDGVSREEEFINKILNTNKYERNGRGHSV